MEEKFNEILNRYGIYGEKPEDVLHAVSDMLKFVAEETSKNEPYAIKFIEDLKKAAYEVWDLSTDL